MADQKPNYVFDKIVRGDDDLVGLVAYSIYKQYKIELIGKLKEKTGLDYIPTDYPELIAFRDMAADQIPVYRSAARNWLDALSSKMHTLESDDFKNYAKEAFKEIMPGFWSDVGKSILGSFFFFVLAGLFIFGYLVLTGKWPP